MVWHLEAAYTSQKFHWLGQNATSPKIRTITAQTKGLVALARQDKVNRYVEVKLPKDQVQRCLSRDGRDVYREPNRDVILVPDMNPRTGRIDGGVRTRY